MNLKTAALAFALFHSTFSWGLFVTIGTGLIKVPEEDGAFGNANVSSATAFLCLTDQSTFDLYAEDSKGLYEAWLAGDKFNSGSFNSQTTVKKGRADVEFECDGYSGQDFYAVAIAEYYSADYGRTFYVARVLSQTYAGDDPDFDTVDFVNAIAEAPRWRYVGDDIPAEPPSITCTAFSVADGVVTATYSISDFSRLGEIVENGTAPVRIAQDVTGTVGATTLNATVTATDETASAFTVSFDTPTGWTTLFLFGFGEAE